MMKRTVFTLTALLAGCDARAAPTAAAATAALRPLLANAAPERAGAHARWLAFATPITVNTSYGPVTGVTDGLVNQFLGVPFAAPPVGPLRWSPPVPPSPWTRAINASWWGPVCPQIDENFYWGLFSGQSEDCLTLNVYVPAGKAPNGGWPMMLWYFGGSYEMGAGGFPVYDGLFLVNKTHRVAIVTMNYRVSTMGWLAGAPLAADSPDGSVGNWGLQDMRRALQFLVDTGASFGGNPKVITVFGESAGGGAVSHLLTNRRAFGE